MSANPQSVTIQFVADLTQARQAYQQFLNWVAANPPRVNFGGGGGGNAPGGYGQNTYITNYITNNYTGPVYNNEGDVVGGGGPGGRGRGGGSGYNSMGGFGRLLRGYFLARAAEHMLTGLADYSLKAGSATSSMERFRAEDALQKNLFETPFIGPIAALATLPERQGTQQTIMAAEQQARYTDVMQQSMLFSHDLQARADISSAGPGTDEARRREIEYRRYQEEQKIKGDNASRYDQITQKYQAAMSATTQQEMIYEVAQKATFGLAGLTGLVTKPDVEGLDATAAKDAENERNAVRRDEAKNRLYAQQIHDDSVKEQDYQITEQLNKAKENQYVQQLRAENKPFSSEAYAMFDVGQQDARASQHMGRPDLAAVQIQTAVYRLQGMQRELEEGGTATESEGLRAVHVGMEGPTGLVSHKEGDDSEEAIGTIRDLVQQLLNQLPELFKAL